MRSDLKFTAIFAFAHAEEAADAEDDCSNLTVFAKNDFIDVADHRRRFWLLRRPLTQLNESSRAVPRSTPVRISQLPALKMPDGTNSHQRVG